MQEIDYKDLIIQILQQYPRHYSKIIKRDYLYIYNFLIYKYPQLSGHKLSEYLYWYIYNLSDFPKCHRHDKFGNTCDNIPRFVDFQHGYKDYCSRSCIQSSIEILNKKKKTNIKRRNCEWPGQSKDVKDKIADTVKKNKISDPKYMEKIYQKQIAAINKNLQNNPNYWSDRYKKRQQTLISKNMDPDWNNRSKFKETLSKFSDEKWHKIKDKALQTHNKHIQEDPDFQNKITQKMRMTKINNGHDWNWHNVEKMLDTKEKRYGNRYYRNVEKAKQTCLEKYGVDSYSKTADYIKNHRKIFKSEKYNIQFDSYWEFQVYDFCIEHKFNVIYNPDIQFKYIVNNKQYIYNPDFLINGKIYEVKGDHFFKEDGTMFCPFRDPDWSDEEYAYICNKYEAKHQCMIKNNVIILKQHDVNNLNEIFGVI